MSNTKSGYLYLIPNRAKYAILELVVGWTEPGSPAGRHRLTEEPMDLRRHAAQTRRRLIMGGLFLILVVGAGLIAITYGTPAAACGISVFLIALVPVFLIVCFLALLQWILRRVDNQAEETNSGENDQP
jgi:hypothetical protein